MPPPDATTAGGQPLWLPTTIDTWWLDRTPTSPTSPPSDAPRWLQPITPGITPELLEEQLVDVPLHTYDTTPAQALVRIYRAVDGLGPVVIIEPIGINPDRVRLDPIRAAVTTDLDRTDPLWVCLMTYTSASWRPELGGLDSIDVDQIWRQDHHQWILADDDHPLTTRGIARLIGQALPLYPRKLITPELLAAKARTAAGQPVELLTDPQNLGQLLAHLDTIRGAPTYDSDPALQYAAGIIATDILRRDENVTAARLLPEFTDDSPMMPPGTSRGVITIPRTLLPVEFRLAQAHRLETPAHHWEVVTAGVGAPMDVHTLSPQAIPTLRRLRRHYLNDVDLPTPLREALTAIADDLASAYRRADPDAAAREAPPLIREHRYDNDHWLIPTYLADNYERIDDIGDVPVDLLWRAQQLPTTTGWSNHENSRWWMRTDWTPTSSDTNPDLPALAYTYETHHRRHRPETAGRATPEASYHLIIEWPSFRNPIDDIDFTALRLVAPPADPDVYRPVFLHHDTTGTLNPLPTDGREGPAWGVSGTDTLTPAVLRWLGHDSYRVRRDRPDTYDAIHLLLWGSGRSDLNQPLEPILQRLADHGHI